MAFSRYLQVFTNANSPVAEAYRTLRTNISLRDFDNNIKVINVTSTNAQEGKSMTALNLAASFSQLNKRTLLIDLDLRLPTLHKKLGIKNSCGITDVVGHNIGFKEAVVNYTNNFDVLLSGTKIPFASEFIQSKALKEFINKIRDSYDYIIIDCPPIGIVADAIITSEYCDGTLLVIGVNKNEKQELIRIKELLDGMNINMLGIVMTGIDVDKKFYGYSYGYTGFDSLKK